MHSLVVLCGDDCAGFCRENDLNIHTQALRVLELELELELHGIVVMVMVMGLETALEIDFEEEVNKQLANLWYWTERHILLELGIHTTLFVYLNLVEG